MSESFTVGDFKRYLAGYSDDLELEFSGGLNFYRIKQRGENLAVVEFNEYEALLSPTFRKKFPVVKVAFCSVESDGSLIQEVRVPEL